MCILTYCYLQTVHECFYGVDYAPVSLHEVHATTGDERASQFLLTSTTHTGSRVRTGLLSCLIVVCFVVLLRNHLWTLTRNLTFGQQKKGNYMLVSYFLLRKSSNPQSTLTTVTINIASWLSGLWCPVMISLPRGTVVGFWFEGLCFLSHIYSVVTSVVLSASSCVLHSLSWCLWLWDYESWGHHHTSPAVMFHVSLPKQSGNRYLWDHADFVLCVTVPEKTSLTNACFKCLEYQLLKLCAPDFTITPYLPYQILQQ